MLKRSASILCLSAIGTITALLAGCGAGETPNAAPEDPTPAGSADAETPKPDASVSAEDASGGASDARATPIAETAEALATLAALRARFALKLAPEMADREWSDDGADLTGNAAPAVPVGQLTRSALGAGLVQGFDVGMEDLVIPHFPSGPSVARPARVALSRKATAPFLIEDTATGMTVEVTLRDGRDVGAEAAEGYLVYPHGHASGATILHRALPEGTEDFLSFDEPPIAPTIIYDLTLRRGVGGLRLVANTLEMLDAKGAPRLRVSPPSVVTADGVEIEATLSVDDCAYDDDAAPPWERPVLAPGVETCGVRLTWPSEGVAYPALLDPKWSTTGSMSVARQDHTATVLSNGKVLVAGGTNGTTTYASAELYDRASGSWAVTGSMTGARRLHTATQLGTSSNSTTSGKVLVAGGLNGATTLNTAQLYSVSAGTWTAAANLNAARKEHSATLLANGKVLIAGGASGSTTLNTAAIYNPASGTGTWTATSNMATARKYHTATLLVTSNATLNNKVLVVGGNSGSASITSVQLFDGNSTWSTLTALSSAREQQTATLLANGKVLIAGGRNGATTLNTALVFNPASGSGSWSSAGTMKSARHGHTATLLSSTVLNDGQVLIAGGWDGSATVSSAEIFTEPSAWALTTALPAAGKYQTASLLSNGMVLLAGGVNAALNPVSTAVLYDPSRGKSCSTTSQCASGFCANGVCCDTACTGECGACNLASLAGTCSPQANGTACSDEGNPCTADKCNGSSLTCQHPAGNAGTICRPPANDCDFPESCSGTSTSCPADSTAPNGTPCNDHNACTTADRCSGGLCVGGPTPPVIDDGKACTVDSCDPAIGPVHTPVAAGTSCADNNLCNGNEVCDAAGTCLAGTPPVLDDNKRCTVDSCDPATGVKHVELAPGASCSDGNLCNGEELCAPGGVCLPGIPPIVDDGNRCTADACDQVLGVTHPPLPAGTSCADGSSCVAGTCDGAGVCVGCGSCTNGVHDGDETGVDCGGSCPACPSGGGCATDGDCATGLVCGTNNGACFGRVPRGSKVCWPSSCEHGGNRLACGSTDSACGSNCDCVNPCQPSDAGPACPTGEVCKLAGSIIPASVAEVCVDPQCPSNNPALCGHPDSLCGQTCVCMSDCSSATCANPGDGCGGLCPGVCGPGATGCTADLTCPPGFACIPGDDGDKTCRPGDCTFKQMTPPRCGVPGAPCGDQCPTCTPRCDGRQCGPDPNCGQSCGACTGPGMYCDGSGQCRAPHPVPPVIGPGGPVVVVPPPLPSTVGAVAGGFSVSEQGTSEYTVPIDVPPGRAGIQPALALKYGGKGNGDLGVGWHLEGLSQITRCPRSQALDNYSEPVRNATSDHFCIDGKRLETVAGVGGGLAGRYGAAGTEYRTLIDSFARVVSNQASGDGVQLDFGGGIFLRLPRELQGPDSFTVWTKDGRILTYGSERDSLVMSRTGMRYGWLLKRVEDRAGNTMTFNYLNVNTLLPVLLSRGNPNLIRPDSISYTGHGSSDGGNRKVVFQYEDRSDPQHKFMQAGVAAMSSQRLARIVTYVEDKPVKNYRLLYGEFGPTQFSQIVRIYECTGDNDTHCKNPTAFDYEADAAYELGSAPAVADNENAGKLDASGDGIPDYLLMTATRHPVEADPWLSVAQIVTDVAIGVASGGAGTVGAIAISTAWSQVSPGFWGLFAKDAVVDIKGSMYIGKLDRVQPATWVSTVHGLPCNGRDASWMLDYDRDGLDDVIGACGGGVGLNIMVSLSSGRGDFVPKNDPVASVPIVESCDPPDPQHPPTHDCLPGFFLPRPMFVDVDGDSLEDLLYCQDHATLVVRRRIGPNFGFDSSPVSISAQLCQNYKPTFNIFDIDGDGTADLLVYNNRDGWQTLRYSQSGTGPSAVPALRWQSVDLPDVKNSRLGAGLTLGDFNGDGLIDMYARPLPPDPFAPITRDPWNPPPPDPPVNDPNVVIWLNGGDNRFSSRTLRRPLPALDNPDPLFGAFSIQQQAVLDHNGDGRSDILESWIALGQDKAHFFNVALLPDSALTRLDWTDPNLYWRDGPSNDGPSVPGGFRLAADLDGDGNTDLFGNKRAFYRGGNRSRLLSRVVDGAGRLTNIRYDEDYPSATYTNTGTGECRNIWPVTCLKRMKGLVSSHDDGYVASDGDEVIERSYEYTYFNGHMNVTGEGWLGFERRKVRNFAFNRLLQDVTTDFTMPSEMYGPDGIKIVLGSPYAPPPPPYFYPLAGLAATVTVDDYPLEDPDAHGSGHIETGLYMRRARVETDWTVKLSAFGRPFPFAHSRLTQTFDKSLSPVAAPFEDNGTLLTFCALVSESDGYGNVTSEQERCQGNNDGPEEETLTLNEPELHPTDWLISNLHHVSKVSTRNEESATQEWLFFYYPNGLLRSVTRAPENTAARQTDFLRDDYGNPTTITEKEFTGEADRFTTIVYDDDNLFPQTITNAKNQSTEVRFDRRFGALIATADPNGIVSSSVYDAFGRLASTTGPEGTSYTTYSDALNALPGRVQHLQVSVESQGTAGSRLGGQKREYDHNGQVVRATTEGLGGALVYQDWTYDDLGRLTTRTVPHTNPDAASAPTDTFAYDRLHHVRRIEHADGSAREYRYASTATLDPAHNNWFFGVGCDPGATCVVDFVQTVDEEGFERVNIADHRGHTVRAIDGDNLHAIEPQSSKYAYGPFNRLRYTQDTAGHVTEYVIDAYGRRSDLIDPDTGLSHSDYSGFDQVKKTKDQKSQVRTFHHDVLGRIELIDEPTGGASQWFYDSGTNAIGRLSGTISPPTAENPTGNRVSYFYEPTTGDVARAFLSQVVTNLDGAVYPVTFFYDDAGRIDRIRYPNVGNDGNSPPVVTKYNYDGSGVMASVDEVGTGTPRSLWRLDGAFEGHLVQDETFGNGASSHYIYNPQRRWIDNIQTTTSAGVVQALDYMRFHNGLVKSRGTSFGQRAYTYDNLSRLFSSIDTPAGGTPQETPYRYDAIGNITTRGNTTLTYVDTQPHLLLDAGGNAYTYDANGNVAFRGGPDIPGGAQSFEYTPFDLPSAIYTGSGPDAKTTRFEYTADEARAIRRDADVTRHFVGGIYQRVVTTGTTDTVEERFSLTAGGRQLGEIVRKNGTEQTLYFHTDHQGSVDTITTDSQAFFAQGFDPFGMPQDPPNPALTRAGYTGHAHDNDLGLIDMKGRIYDQFAARFTSPDPATQAPFSTQGLNRYSYAFNDPVNNIDPSGFQSMGFGEDILFSDLHVQASAPAAWSSGCGACSIWEGAPSSFAGPSNGIAGISGANLAIGLGAATATVVMDLMNPGLGGAQAGAQWHPSVPSAGAKTLGAGLGIPTAVAQAQGAPGPQPAQQTVAQFEAQLIANNQSPVSQPAPTFDPQTEGHLRQLHPQVEALAREHLLELWSAGLKPQITQSYRSIAAQNALYAQGRTTPGAIVTNARGGSSLHNYRLAYDIGLFNSYNGAFSGYISNGLDPSYTLAGKMGQDVGLTWGGTFTTIYDAPHFQLTWGIPMQDIQARWAAHLDVFTGL